MVEDATSRNLKRAGFVGALIALGLVGIGVAGRHREAEALVMTAAGNAVPIVAVVSPTLVQAKQTRSLPGRLQALNSAPIYARTTGYVRQWLVDIGDTVHAGQTLAIIDAPEVDQQLVQARADYKMALANRELARTTSERWTAMLGRDAVSRQETDEKRGGLAASSAVADAARANVSRLASMQGFTRVTAPFAGVVTTRSTQVGALVMAGSVASTPLFTIADLQRIRVFVRVPQSLTSGIRTNLTATIRLPEYPDRSFLGTVTRTAGAVDPASGTMLVELQLDNRDRALKPGSYAEVSLPSAPARAVGLRLPPSALLFRSGGVSVAVLSPDNRATLRRIRIGRDEGTAIEIVAGLKAGERIVDNPPDALATGDLVRVAKPAARLPGDGKR